MADFRSHVTFLPQDIIYIYRPFVGDVTCLHFLTKLLTNSRRERLWTWLENVYFVNNLQKTVCLPLKFIYVLDFGLIRIIYEDTMKKIAVAVLQKCEH